MFDYDFSKVPDDQNKQTRELLPKGWYDAEIITFTSQAGKTWPIEGKTKNGDTKIDLMVDIKGNRLFHTVTFMAPDKPGAGIAKHFVKTIGEPLDKPVNSDMWVGKKFKAYVVEDEYQGKKSNKIKQVEPIGETKDDSLPF